MKRPCPHCGMPTTQDRWSPATWRHDHTELMGCRVAERDAHRAG